MRTPGDDRALAAGFLLAEGIVRGFDDIGAIEHCRHPSRPEEHNVVDVYLLGAAAATLPRVLDERRNVLATFGACSCTDACPATSAITVVRSSHAPAASSMTLKLTS